MYDPSDELVDVLEGPEPPWDEPPEAPPDAERANRMVARLARLRLRREADVALARQQVEQVNAWLLRRIEVSGGQERWIETALEHYHRAVLSTRPSALTISLPAGDLRSNAGQPTWEWTDETAFLAWAKENLPVAVRQKPAPEPEVDKAEAKKALTRRDAKGKPVKYGITDGGEEPPGLAVKPAERTYHVVPRTGDDSREETADDAAAQ